MDKTPQNARRSGPRAELSAADCARLTAMEERLRRRSLPPEFIAASVRATAGVLRDLAPDPARPAAALQREEVRAFVASNDAAPAAFSPVRSERRRLEAEELHSHVLDLLEEARSAHARHEVRKTHSRLRQVDRRRVVRLLGGEGVELLCQINACLHGE